MRPWGPKQQGQQPSSKSPWVEHSPIIFSFSKHQIGWVWSCVYKLAKRKRDWNMVRDLPPKHRSNWVTSFPPTYQDTAIRKQRSINRFGDSISIIHSYSLLFIITFTTQGPWRHKILCCSFTVPLSLEYYTACNSHSSDVRRGISSVVEQLPSL